jgi:hypothetical protein
MRSKHIPMPFEELQINADVSEVEAPVSGWYGAYDFRH